MNNAKKIGGVLFAALWILIFGNYTFALDPNQAASNFLRTHFTTDEGLPGSVVDRIEQTRDGFLWLRTNGVNLIRFDGTSFYQFDSRPTTFAVAPDGDLWVGTNEGLIRIPSSNFDQFTLTGSTSYQPGPGKASNIGHQIRFTKSGEMWVGTADGLFRYDGHQFMPVGPRVEIRELEAAPDGNLLVVTADGFIELRGSEVVPHPKLAARLGIKDNEIFHALKDTHGNIWYSTKLGVAREVSGRIEKLATYGPGGHGVSRAYEDAQGTVWIGKEEGGGLFRATSAGLELVAAGMKVRSLYSDRDGNLWVGTNGDGLYRFKDRAIRMFTTKDGLPNDVIQTALVAHDGAVWTGANCGGISRFDGEHFQTFNEKNGLLNSCVWALAEDANHDLWIGTWGGGAFRFHSGSFTQYSKNDGLVDDRVAGVVAARDGSVWFATRNGVSRLVNGKIRNFTTADGLSGNAVYRILEDRTGVIWAGTRQGLDRLVGERFENVDNISRVLAIPQGSDRDGGFFVTLGVKSVTVRLADDGTSYTIKELRNAWTMVQTETGEIWFGGDAISRIYLNNFSQPRPNDAPLDYEAFSMADGLATAETSNGAQDSLALTGDRRLWAATPKGLAMIDLSRLPSTTAKPAIYLKELTIGRNKQHATRELVLPPGTNHVDIDFAAIEISSPEKIRLQYRLDGVDSEWLDAGPAPHAIYSTMPVGTHALHIRACNRNGIWDRQGVVFTITQQPFFYQTRWFIGAMFALGVFVVAMFHRLRVRQISRSIGARFDERLAERTRVAREVHDTFLQTVQGSKLVADHALKDPSDNARMVRAMEQLSAWLGQATEEGRAALNSLRASTTERNDLADAFRRAIDECRIQSRADISFSVTGDPREMHPVVRDEVYRIGYEAIRNSCAHSGGDRLNVTLEYAHDLTLHISDDGAGIDPEIAETGKEGHFGLPGMKERAERIGSKFTLVSSPDTGTAITLIVPGRVIFPSDRPHWTERVKSLFGRN
ncbi:MAG TPA: two-component regulator propeller domain-containing protein [Blastocatellia bacterium]|nr:two-component regulator propeller domain-containing protein [Blastocatellia bacterium]